MTHAATLRRAPRNPLAQLAAEAKRCTACPLWRNATQTVFGEGSARARLMLVGEQPGDQEDLQGHPFVGPAGKLLDRALEAAQIRRADAYVTNAVKHFKWEPRGKRRVHKTPAQREVEACRPWLEQEIALVKPQVIVCLGATAGRALLGREFRVTHDRGRILEGPFAAKLVATIHPSAILRLRDAAERDSAFTRFVGDLGVAKRALALRAPHAQAPGALRTPALSAPRQSTARFRARDAAPRAGARARATR